MGKERYAPRVQVRTASRPVGAPSQRVDTYRKRRGALVAPEVSGGATFEDGIVRNHAARHARMGTDR